MIENEGGVEIKRYASCQPSTIRSQVWWIQSERGHPIRLRDRKMGVVRLAFSRQECIVAVFQRGGIAIFITRTFPPGEDGLMLRTHAFIELVRLVHLVGLCLFGIEPALKKLGVILGKDGIAVLYLAKLELQGADLVVQDLDKARGVNK